MFLDTAHVVLTVVTITLAVLGPVLLVACCFIETD